MFSSAFEVSIIFTEMSLALAFFNEIPFSKRQFCKKLNRKERIDENGDIKGLKCKNFHKKGHFGENGGDLGIQQHFGDFSPNIPKRITPPPGSLYIMQKNLTL